MAFFLYNRSDLDETLVIVTADHSHALTINGYPERGNDILGIARKSKYDGVPYTTLLYATGGPNSVQMEITDDGKIKRKDPTNDDTKEYTYIQQAAVQSDENAHSGSDVSKIILSQLNVIYELKCEYHLMPMIFDHNFTGSCSCHWTNVTFNSACP